MNTEYIKKEDIETLFVNQWWCTWYVDIMSIETHNPYKEILELIDTEIKYIETFYWNHEYADPLKQLKEKIIQLQ